MEERGNKKGRNQTSKFYNGRGDQVKKRRIRTLRPIYRRQGVSRLKIELPNIGEGISIPFKIVINKYELEKKSMKEIRQRSSLTED